jgi:hypothetical protein
MAFNSADTVSLEKGGERERERERELAEKECVVLLYWLLNVLSTPFYNGFILFFIFLRIEHAIIQGRGLNSSHSQMGWT